jgi:hypothetical protein
MLILILILILTLTVPKRTLLVTICKQGKRLSAQYGTNMPKNVVSWEVINELINCFAYDWNTQ